MAPLPTPTKASGHTPGAEMFTDNRFVFTGQVMAAVVGLVLAGAQGGSKAGGVARGYRVVRA